MRQMKLISDRIYSSTSWKEILFNFLIIFLMLFSVVAAICNSVAIPVFLIFLVLKLINVINWAWIYIFLPLIIMAGTIIIQIVTSLITSWISGDV